MQSGAVLGGRPHVTTAFFNVLLDKFDSSYPGGGYHPFLPLAGKQDVTCFSSSLKRHSRDIGVI